MKNTKLIIGLVVLVLLLIVLRTTLYTVSEKEQVVITQFGKPVGEAIVTPGLKVKKPFIHTVNKFEKRFLEWDGDPEKLTTKDKTYIFVDCYARWQISDPLLFFKRLKNERGAQSRLDDILDGATRNNIANHNLEEAVRTSNRKPVKTGEISELLEDTLSPISEGRKKIQQMILESANEKAMDLGIIILDFRFKRINYTGDVQTKVYERMKSERFRIAEKYRSEGQGEASRINGEKERELKTIQSEAYRTAEEIRGRADAGATAIYASAYDKSVAAREFYSFLKSMETFSKTFDDETSVILSTDSELYRYLKGY